MSQALRHARAAGVPEGTQEAPRHGKRLRMCNKLFLNLDCPHPSTTSWRSGYNWPSAETLTRTHTHPGSVCEAALFRDMAAKSLEEVGTGVREVSTPRTDWVASV